MAKRSEPPLSRRERQILDVLYARGEASALDVVAALPDPPGKTAVRTLLKILEDKGHVLHREAGQTYVYRPSRPREHAGQSALQRVLEVFFRGSLQDAVAVHLADPSTRLDETDLQRLESLIREARQKGRKS